jgi:hypothetical protein
MNIGLLASQAGAAYLAALDPALTTVTNFYAQACDPDIENVANNRNIPCVFFWASDAKEFPHRSGNFNLALHVRLVSSADDQTEEEFSATCTEVFNAINTDTICADLSAAIDDFHCFGFWDDVQQLDPRFEGRNRIVEMVLPLNCCSRDVS